MKLDHAELVFCCSTTIFNRFKMKEDILRSLPIARSNWDHQYNQLVSDYLSAHKIYPEEYIDSDHLDFYINLSRRGRAVMIIPKNVWSRSLWRNEIVAFHLGQPIFLDSYVVWSKSRERMVAIRKLKELLTISGYPDSYRDPEHQIKIQNIPRHRLQFR